MGLSRNKVAVPEGAAGSPPFYGVSGHVGACRVPPARGMVPCLSGGCWCGRDRWFSGWCFRSGEWCGYAFGLPDRHRILLRVWRGPAHRRGLAGFVSVGCVRWRAWWFENWIVDASNRKTCLFSVALSRFRQTPFVWGLVRDRSFCDHLQCDENLSSGDLAGRIRWPCAFCLVCGVAGEGVGWMPWQTVPMKDV